MTKPKPCITARRLPDGRPIVLVGREAWALAELAKAGSRGVTPLDNPAPRWSAYIHTLRHEHGFPIHTEYEQHFGPYAGNHARYRILCSVEIDGTTNGGHP